ncbi:MAG: membrane-associated phospholipid phosphatase [Saprospiraceae bacterium]|jgi:membrane-associated phospholipid phosphatase
MRIFRTNTLKILILGIILSIVCSSIYGQESVYKLNAQKDGIILGVGIGTTLLGHFLAGKSDKASEVEIVGLNINNLNFLDRSSALNNSRSAITASDVILYSSVIYPLGSYLTRGCRKEKVVIGVMAIETILITNGITNIIKSATKRYRPYNYNPTIPLQDKLVNSSRFSFVSGHTSITSAMSFFTAKVIIDSNLDMKNKFLVWIPSAFIPAAIGYFRVKGGRHFPTDVISGYLLGATVGYLIPSLHKREDIKMEFSYDKVGLRYEF